jgi:hypothetical protein
MTECSGYRITQLKISIDIQKWLMNYYRLEHQCIFKVQLQQSYTRIEKMCLFLVLGGLNSHVSYKSNSLNAH